MPLGGNKWMSSAFFVYPAAVKLGCVLRRIRISDYQITPWEFLVLQSEQWTSLCTWRPKNINQHRKHLTWTKCVRFFQRYPVLIWNCDGFGSILKRTGIWRACQTNSLTSMSDDFLHFYQQLVQCISLEPWGQMKHTRKNVTQKETHKKKNIILQRVIDAKKNH